MKLYPYQQEGVKRIKEFGGRVLLADDMGLGKTIQALTYLQQTPKAKPAIVVCPASVKFVWEQEATLAGYKQIKVLNGQTPSKIPTDMDLVILNYDILQHWLPILKQFKAKTIIFDEAHFLKNIRSKRYAAAKQLSKRIPYILALSGTPITNRPAEFWPVLNMLRPKFYPAFWPFAETYCNLKKGYWGWDWSGATNIDDLNKNLIEQVMIRRRKEDVLKDLPAKQRRVVPCELEHPSEYKKAVTDFRQQLNSQGGQSAVGLVMVGSLLRLAAELKIKAMVRWIDEHLESTDGKLVVFAKHHKIIDALREKCQYKSVQLDGRMSQKEREASVMEFQHSNIRLFIGNIQAAGVGITLTAASTVAFAELDWVPGNMMQAEDRCHRIGQKSTVWVNYLIAKNTIEESVCRVLRKKQDVVSRTVDGETQDKFDIFQEILGELK